MYSEKRLVSYRKVAETLINPMTDKQGHLIAGYSRTYFTKIRGELVTLGIVKKVGEIGTKKIHIESIHQFALDNFDNFIEELKERKLNFNDDENIEDVRSQFRGAMARVNNLSEKLKEQSRLIHRDRQKTFRKQGALSTGGVEFV